MARIADLKLGYRIFMEAYPYRHVDWRPGAVLAKPLAQARVALVTSAGFYRPDQAPFDESIRGGDWSYREIAADTPVDSLQSSQTSDAFDHTGIQADPNLALPVDRLKELAAEGTIGSVAPMHFSIMGSLSAPGRLVSQSAPEIARRLGDESVDAVLLTPV
jgi:D-proline reductase (dithiol) PrdB